MPASPARVTSAFESEEYARHSPSCCDMATDGTSNSAVASTAATHAAAAADDDRPPPLPPPAMHSLPLHRRLQRAPWRRILAGLRSKPRNGRARVVSPGRPPALAHDEGPPSSQATPLKAPCKRHWNCTHPRRWGHRDRQLGLAAGRPLRDGSTPHTDLACCAAGH